VIYLYAIAERAPGLAPPSAPLRVVTHGRLAGVCCSTARERVEPTEEALWQHERVVQELMRDRAVLPLRFGSLLASEHALRSLLRTREDEFCDALDFVRDRVEVSVRARLDVPDSATTPRSGRAYLAAKLERRRVAEQLASTLHSELAPFARASTFRAIERPDPELAAAYLVDRERLDEFMLRAREFDARRPEAGLACTGPWPPFSFATAVEQGDG
jgi:hypothetical protein